MATQDFKDGGFYGKLGQLVGQRLGNKRIVRTYVIGANPRTPEQQANRATFAIATRLAQEAFNLNKGDPAWKALGTSEFSKRVGTALRRLHKGATEEEAFPLYPDGYVPTRVLSFGAFFPASPGTVSIYFQGAALPAGAECTITVIYNSYANGNNYTFSAVDTLTTSRNYFTISFDIYDIVYGSTFTVSAASTPAGDQVIECGMQETSVGNILHYTDNSSPTVKPLSIQEADQDFFDFPIPDYPGSGWYYGQLTVMALNADGTFLGWYTKEVTDNSAELNFYWNTAGFTPENNGQVLAFFDWLNNYDYVHARGNGQETVVYH
jgi:hypothetical protein